MEGNKQMALALNAPSLREVCISALEIFQEGLIEKKHCSDVLCLFMNGLFQGLTLCSFLKELRLKF